VQEGEILVRFEEVEPKPEKIKEEFERWLADIEKNINYVNNDLRSYNEGLVASIRQNRCEKKVSF
jgi:parvulin-like peptidyl-prolyl isomerase